MVDSRVVPAPLPSLELMPLDEMQARLDRVLTASPADETEIAWLEVRRGREGLGKTRDGERRERSLLVRVRESGRAGFQRTGESTISELENAVRMALAQARLAPAKLAPAAPRTAPKPGSSGPGAAAANRPTDRGPELWDSEIAGLHPGKARHLVQHLAGPTGTARLAWALARVAVGRSDGRRRSAEITAAGLEVRHGSGPGTGRATAAARTWTGLAAEAVAERGRRLATPSALAELPAGPRPLLLAPEATAALVALLNHQALTSAAFQESISFLRDRLGQQVFHPAVSLRDDAGDPRGLPFPFDISGDAKRPVDLIADGVALTPAIDAALGRELGRETTAHAVAADESRASHLFLRPGDCDEGEALRRTEGGLWLGWLSGLACFDRRELRFRAVAHGVRRIEGGALGRAVPDLIWEGSLTAVLAEILGVGREAITVADEPLLGAVSAPSLAIGPVGGFRPAPNS